MRPTTQFRFVETTLAAVPSLSEEIKYVASYRMDDGRLAVLAQGKDKYSLKKWGGILGDRRHPAIVSAVDDMGKALEYARTQEEFKESGRYTYTYSKVGQPASARRSMPPPASKTQEEPAQSKTQQGPGKSGNDEEEFRIPKKEEYNTPGHVQAREWVQERLKYEQQKEAMTAMLMADYVEVDVDIDRVRPTMSLEEMRLHDIATTRRVCGVGWIVVFDHADQVFFCST